MAGVRLKGNTSYQLEIKWDGTNWTDETARLKSFAIRRGYGDDQTEVQAGELNLVMADINGRYSPINTSSALYPNIGYPLREVRLRETYASNTYYLFSGYTVRHASNPARDEREARIDCLDGMVLLEGVRPTIASSETTTGAAIGAILTAAGFTGATDLDTGDAITFEADGTDDALSIIGDLLQTERGFLFFSASGTATYLDRSWTNRSPYNTSQATIASTMQDINPAVDLRYVRNRATATATGGTAQTASDATSIARYKTRDYPPITSSYLASDAAAASLAAYLVSQYKDPLPPVKSVELGQHDSATYTQLLTRELGDHVTITESLGGTSGSWHIRTIQHAGDWSAGEHTATWALVRRSSLQPFLIEISLIGGTDYITY